MPDLIEAVLYWMVPLRQAVVLSHSIPAVAATALIAGACLATAGRGGDAVVAAMIVASHWPLDAITATKPTWPGLADVGLNLYDSWPIDWMLEVALVLVVLRIFSRQQRLIDWRVAGSSVALQTIAALVHLYTLHASVS